MWAAAWQRQPNLVAAATEYTGIRWAAHGFEYHCFLYIHTSIFKYISYVSRRVHIGSPPVGGS
jgi:hypothetical protein